VKIFIAGCGGMLGRAMYSTFIDNNILAVDIDKNESWIEYGDITNYSAMRSIIKEFKPDFILNLAAKTDLEFCDANPLLTHATNYLAAVHLAKLADEMDSVHVFISTAGVYNGLKDFYTEDDVPMPLNVYGKCKYDAEKEILKLPGRHYIFRAGWMMGGGKKDKKFVSKIYKQILAGKKKIFVVNDRYGVPTYTYDFSSSLKRLLEEGLECGLYNLVCSGSGNRVDVARHLLYLIGREDIKITEVDSLFFKDEYSSERPYSEILISKRLTTIGKNYMRDWRDCLKDYVSGAEFNEISL
jgi:dTDP-4-dehydrorhamnose reductase